MSGLDYFYDGQIERYLLQAVNMFNGFQYEYITRDGTPALRRVPARYGDQSRMVGHIMKNNSENIINSAPFMTLHIDNMEYAPDRRQDPSFVGKIQVSERDWDDVEEDYTGEQGQKYTVERFMPVPYNMFLKLDIWTTNMKQKLQLFEQIAVLFNPDLNIQNSVNPLDWSALTYMDLTGNQWSSRTIPVGSDTSIEITSMNFTVPIWINPPAKVKKQQVINQMITNILEEHACFGTTDVRYSEADLLGRKVETPNNHFINVDGNEITLLNDCGGERDKEGNIYEWQNLLDTYGSFEEGVTLLRLKRFATILDETETLVVSNQQRFPDYDVDGLDIVGTLDIHPTEPNKLLWAIDPMTLPVDTINPITAIIDPHKTFPSAGLSMPIVGQQYLLLNDIGGTDGPGAESGTTQAWGNLTADVDDVIIYTGTEWVVFFDASIATDPQFVTNNFTGKQLYWNKTDGWILAIDGKYQPGTWRLIF